MLKILACTLLSSTVLALPAAAVPVTYTYKSLPLVAPTVPGGYFLNGQPYSDTGPRSFTFQFTVELDALGGSIANTSITQKIQCPFCPSGGQLEATATRNGSIIAQQDDVDWFSAGFPRESLSYSGSFSFDAAGEISSWNWGTDGESASYSFGSPNGDLFFFATIGNWEPTIPMFQSRGPGTWTHTALPTAVPLPAAGWLLGAAALAFAGAIRTRRRSG